MEKLYKKPFVLLFSLICIGFLFAQCGKSTDARLKELVEETNKMCPHMLDQWTRLDSCAVQSGSAMRYYHSIVGELIVTDTTLFKSKLEPQIISAMKTNPDVKFYRDNDITMEYQYNDTEGKYIFSMIITPDNYKK